MRHFIEFLRSKLISWLAARAGSDRPAGPIRTARVTMTARVYRAAEDRWEDLEVR